MLIDPLVPWGCIQALDPKPRARSAGVRHLGHVALAVPPRCGLGCRFRGFPDLPPLGNAMYRSSPVAL